jgi:uncharacterized protein (TIGR03066 family)
VKSKEKVPIPFGTTFDYTKDGKVNVTIPGKDKGPPIRLAGTYKVDGKKIVISLTAPDGMKIPETHTIKTLTATSLIVEDKIGYVLEFKSKAPGKVGK